ncbi:hypothetical protein FRC09_012838, partial [Ceratobasidium sp. 395]
PTSTPVSSTSTPATSTTPVSTSASTPLVPTTSSAPATTPLSTLPLSTSPRTTLNVPPTTSFVLTTSSGTVFTATVVVGGNPNATAGNATAKKPFFQNTGAVVGVFVVVGIAATALAVFFITVFLRRRRARQFDREVQDAAREAALAQAPVDDDDYGANASYNTHASQPMSTERPGYSGYSTGASSWDPYGRAGAGAAGYEMHNRRTSTSTAPGMAGFAAGDSFARTVGIDAPQQGYNSNQPQGYGPAYGQQGYNHQQQQGYNNQQQQQQQQQQGYQSYNNTSPPQSYALAQERGPARAAPKPQMMMPEAQRQQNYNTVEAFRASPSYGQAHPGEQVEYGHADNGGYYGRPSEDAYGGYERYDYGQAGGSASNGGHTNNSASASASMPPAYAPGSTGNAGATGDRKRGGGGGGGGMPVGGGGANVARQPSSKSAATRYSQDESEGSADEQPQRRVLKVANE